MRQACCPPRVKRTHRRRPVMGEVRPAEKTYTVASGRHAVNYLRLTVSAADAMVGPVGQYSVMVRRAPLLVACATAMLAFPAAAGAATWGIQPVGAQSRGVQCRVVRFEDLLRRRRSLVGGCFGGSVGGPSMVPVEAPAQPR